MRAVSFSSIFGHKSGRIALIAGAAVVTLTATACGSSSSTTASSAAGTSAAAAPVVSSSAASAAPSSAATSGSSSAATSGSSSVSSGGAVDAASATSAADFGGMAGLVAAANKEGKLNVIALPPNWADYADIIKGFQSKYPNIKVNSEAPEDTSAQEIQAADTNKGTDQAPDVFDIGQAVTLKSLSYFAPYKVAAWAQIPAANKEATGLWYNDYTGIMSVGYDATKYGTITSLSALTDPKFKGQVALNNSPVTANSPLQAVMMASLANGGSLDDISKGVAYFKSLKQAGTLSGVKASPQVVASGQIGVIFDWSYNQAAIVTAATAEGISWKTFTPAGVSLGGYYNQAISKTAANPAAARLWEEYLYTAEAQNLWIKGGAKPVLYDVMKAAGTIDADDAKNLPAVSGTVVTMSDAQTTKANAYIAANWAAAVG